MSSQPSAHSRQLEIAYRYGLPASEQVRHHNFSIRVSMMLRSVRLTASAPGGRDNEDDLLDLHIARQIKLSFVTKIFPWTPAWSIGFPLPYEIMEIIGRILLDTRQYGTFASLTACSRFIDASMLVIARKVSGVDGDDEELFDEIAGDNANAYIQ